MSETDDIIKRAYDYGSKAKDPMQRMTDSLAYKAGAIEQRKIDIEKLKDVMNRLMLNTRDKAEIIKAMDE